MIARLMSVARAVRIALARRLRRPAEGDLLRAEGVLGRVHQARGALVAVAVAAIGAWALATHPPVRTAGSGEVGVRTNRLTGAVTQWRDGSLPVLPGLHDAQVFSVRDRVYKPAQLASASGGAPEEAMKHVLPFKERQIQQRRLEAEAERQSRLKIAEGNAQARRIEADGEADARRKLAAAEAFRMDTVGQASAQQMAREGTLLSRHPLLIRKTLAGKLSDKVQVIIAPPGFGGGFLAANLLGGGQVPREGGPQHAAMQAAEGEQ